MCYSEREAERGERREREREREREKGGREREVREREREGGRERVNVCVLFLSLLFSHSLVSAPPLSTLDEVFAVLTVGGATTERVRALRRSAENGVADGRTLSAVPTIFFFVRA